MATAEPHLARSCLAKVTELGAPADPHPGRAGGDACVEPGPTLASRVRNIGPGPTSPPVVMGPARWVLVLPKLVEGGY